MTYTVGLIGLTQAGYPPATGGRNASAQCEGSAARLPVRHGGHQIAERLAQLGELL